MASTNDQFDRSPVDMALFLIEVYGLEGAMRKAAMTPEWWGWLVSTYLPNRDLQ